MGMLQLGFERAQSIQAAFYKEAKASEFDTEDSVLKLNEAIRSIEVDSAFIHSLGLDLWDVWGRRVRGKLNHHGLIVGTELHHVCVVHFSAATKRFHIVKCNGHDYLYDEAEQVRTPDDCAFLLGGLIHDWLKNRTVTEHPANA